MKMGIIAAGTGERLAAGGVATPKPLLPIRGKPLIMRMIEAGIRLQVSSIVCIVNDLNPAVAAFLRSTQWPMPLELVVRTTPSSMESLFCLAPYLADEPFLLSTVDAVCPQATMEDFVSNARKVLDASGALAVTRFVDDEKPLRVAMNDLNRIVALGDAAQASGLVTAGFYYFRPEIFAEIASARAKNLTALRQFLAHLIARDYPIYGIPVAKTIDVDYPDDIEKAEAFLMELNEP